MNTADHPPVSGEPSIEDAAVRWALAGPAPTGTQVPGIDDTISELHAANRDSNDLCDEIHPRIDHSRWQARATPPPLDVAAEVAYEMKVFLHGAQSAPPVAPGWLARIEEWRGRLTGESSDD